MISGGPFAGKWAARSAGWQPAPLPSVPSAFAIALRRLLLAREDPTCAQLLARLVSTKRGAKRRRAFPRHSSNEGRRAVKRRHSDDSQHATRYGTNAVFIYGLSVEALLENDELQVGTLRSAKSFVAVWEGDTFSGCLKPKPLVPGDQLQPLPQDRNPEPRSSV